ncbi:hypothetical protein Tco_0350250 [Tanacetum coccineum]
MLLELLYRTMPQNNSWLLFRVKRFWPELKPPESEKPLLPWRFQLKALIEIDLLEGVPDSSLRQLSNDGSEQEDQASESRVAKGGNVGGQAMPPPQEIHTGFDPRGSSADDLGISLNYSPFSPMPK